MLILVPNSLSKFKTLSLLFLLVLFFSTCTKPLSVKWVQYDETNCADRWDHVMNNEKQKDIIVSYLKSNGIKVFEIEIFSDKPAEACSSCECKTGRTIKCKIGKRDLNDIKSYGFYQ